MAAQTHYVPYTFTLLEKTGLRGFVAVLYMAPTHRFVFYVNIELYYNFVNLSHSFVKKIHELCKHNSCILFTIKLCTKYTSHMFT